MKINPATVDATVQARLRALGSTYAIFDTKAGGRGGVYNINLTALALTLALGSVGARLGWFHPSAASIALFAFISVSQLLALFLDGDDFGRKVDVRALPTQIVATVELLAKWFVDNALTFVSSFLCWCLIAPYWGKFSLFGGQTFWILYGAYFVVRSILLGKYSFDVWRNWDKEAAPFQIRHANLKNRKEAARHLWWSYFEGNMGLAARCARQVVVVFLFEKLRLALGVDAMQLGRTGSIAAAIGGAVGFALIARRLSVEAPIIYYKVHRTLHENRTLYAAIHRIHHRAFFPTVLDSGTESGLELVMAEWIQTPMAVLPDWGFIAVELYMIKFHFRAHHPRLSEDGMLNPHVNHHRLVRANYACFNRVLDEWTQTAFRGRYGDKLELPSARAAGDPLLAESPTKTA